MDYNEREAQRRQEDRDLNRALIWVGAAVVLEFLLSLINKYYINFRTTPESINLALAISAALNGLRWVSLAALAACVVWVVLRLKQGGRAGLQLSLAAVSAALYLCAQITLVFQESGIRMLFWLVPAWAALALVYYLYQPECFLAVTAGGFGAMGLWFVRFGGMTVDVALCLVGAVLVALVTLGLKKSDGALMQAGGKKVQWAPQGISYALVLASCVLGVLVVIAAAALGSNAAYYLMFAMVAWLFALVVYYTVKMM